MSAVDVVELTRALVRRPSVTPEDAGSLDVVTAALEPLGFVCHRLPFSEPGTADVDNLYARRGKSGPNFCFAGHTDVVPAGDRDAWSVDPFAGEVRDDHIMGRGAADMKGAIASFIAATDRYLSTNPDGPPGSISLLITGDEEGPAINGTVKMLDWIEARGERLDACLVGEPTNPTALGESIKIGRRGSLNAKLTVFGTQGHVAYPELADNPVPALLEMLTAIATEPLDGGSEYFQPSNLEITSIDAGNPATNVIPARITANFNLRFNDHHDSAAVRSWLGTRLDRQGRRYELDVHVTGEPFLSPPGPLSDLIGDAVAKILGRRPALTTTGGTSDARFIHKHCPVAEFGMIGQTMHKIDERCAIADLETLTGIYLAVLEGYFAAP